MRERGVKFPIVFCSGSSYSPQTLANVRNVLHVELIVRKPIQPNKAAQQNGDIWGLQSSADRSHQLRGTAGSLGFNRLSLVAGELEDCLREEVGNDLACPLFNSIAINSLIEQLETLINGDQELDIENESEKPHDFLLSNKRALLIDSDQEENDIFCTEMNDLQDWRTIGLTDCSTIFAVLDKYQPSCK